MRGRPRQFNEREVLSKAASLFREKGYAATSMSALSRAMGMGEQSIYNAFGNKEAVYRAALEQYCQNGDSMLEALENPGDAPREAIEAFFAQLVDYLSANPNPCLVAQSCLSSVANDKAISELISARMRRVEDAFLCAVEAGVAQGQFHAEDPRGLARYLNLALQGLNVVARTTTSRKQLQDLVSISLDRLR